MFIGGFLGFVLDNTVPGKSSAHDKALVVDLERNFVASVGATHQSDFHNLLRNSHFISLRPGTKRERGLLDWNKVEQLDDSDESMPSEELYDLPFGITAFLSSQSWVRFIPFCPRNGDGNQCRPEDVQGRAQR